MSLPSCEVITTCTAPRNTMGPAQSGRPGPFNPHKLQNINCMNLLLTMFGVSHNLSENIVTYVNIILFSFCGG